MSLSKRYRLIVMISFLSTMAACASNSIYRNDFRACEVLPNQHCELFSVQHHRVGTDAEYTLGFVEIDDQGQLRDRKQMNALLDTLYAMSNKHDLLINVFVHGWHHNASPEDGNIRSFEQSLAALSQIEAKSSRARQGSRRKVVGVYVGWRGESITLPLLNNLTFWDRKNTAQEVGMLGMAELLLRLEEIRNVKNTQNTLQNNRLVIIGHSFGGAAVFSATSQILASRYVDTRADKNVVDTPKRFGDLIVLLNPAFEALRYAPLYDLSQARCGYFGNIKPSLVILTSESDYATKLAFPIGRIFSTFFESHQTVERNDCGHTLSLDEGAADWRTVGHFDPLISHTLTLVENDQKRQSPDYETINNLWFTQEKGGSTQLASTVLKHLGRTSPKNPFLNIRVDKRLIADHNDVFGKEIMEFLRLMIVLSTSE